MAFFIFSLAILTQLLAIWCAVDMNHRCSELTSISRIDTKTFPLKEVQHFHGWQLVCNDSPMKKKAKSARTSVVRIEVTVEMAGPPLTLCCSEMQAEVRCALIQ